MVIVTIVVAAADFPVRVDFTPKGRGPCSTGPLVGGVAGGTTSGVSGVRVSVCFEVDVDVFFDFLLSGVNFFKSTPLRLNEAGIVPLIVTLSKS